MRKFLTRLLLFLLLPLPLLFFLDHAVTAGLHKSRFLYYADWNDLFAGKIDADLIVLGSSRAYLHVSPRILDSMLLMNTYNLGMDGCTFPMQQDILRLYLKHNKKPRYILQEVGFPIFAPPDTIQYRHEMLAYVQDTTVRSILEQRGVRLSFGDRYVPLFRYNGELPLLAEGLRSYVGLGAKEVKYKGYEGRDQPWDSTFYFFKKKYPNGMMADVDTGIMRSFSAYLGFCTANEIQVILFYAPTYYESRPYILNFAEIHKSIQDTAIAHDVPFLDYTEDTLNAHRYYFYNTQHLNKKGSELFSQRLAKNVQASFRLRKYK